MVYCEVSDFDHYLKDSCTKGHGIKLQLKMARNTDALNFLYFERCPLGISSPSTLAKMLVCHS